MSEDIAPAHPYSPRQPPAAQPNGMPKPPRSNTLDSHGQVYEDDQAYLAPNRVSELSKKGSGDVSANSSDPDSVLDYYKAPDGRNGTAKTKSKKKTGKQPPPNWAEAEKDQNNWIHRDKLKEIETRELEEAGFKVGRASRSNSRSHSVRRASRDRTNSETTDSAQNGDDRLDNRRVVSPIPAEGEEEEAEYSGWDLRTPEEIAMEREQYAARNNLVRPGTSRIPVAKTSPLPVPNTFVERDQPLPRSRKGSANWTGDAIAVNGARVRSGSTSSQVLLDEPSVLPESQRSPMQGNFSTPVSPVSGSPPKAKTPGKSTPTSATRKTSVQKSQSKARNVSGTSPVKRPGTSGGSISRPSTSHRPEGEAPWLATMYKPDPMLPPDQQIIPTHAKRMQQEQWENEGRVGSMYDKDFRLLNTDDFTNKRASQIQPIDIEKAQEDQQWPLPSPDKPALDSLDANVKSPTNEQSSYKLTPTIPQSPRVPSRSSVRNHSLKPTNTTRVPEPPVDAEKEKKGCCCIVM